MSELSRWAAELGYDRIASSLLRAESGCPANHPFAPEVRSLFSVAPDIAPASAVYCVDQVPTVCLVESANVSQVAPERKNQIRKLCERLWNQNLARVVLVLSPHGFEAWSVDNPKIKPESITENDRTKIDDWSAQGLLSGDVLKKRDSWFDSEKRVDKSLLDNITTLIDHLRDAGLKASVARELIAKIIFVAYLEDRGIITQEYRGARKVEALYDLLDNRDAVGLEWLFKNLRKDFNGDFLQSAVSTNQTWRRIPKLAFTQLHEFLGQTVLRSGEKNFWRYDFSQIPIELIAGIYETFLASKSKDENTSGEFEDSKRKQGAYYTPRILADWVVDLALRDRDLLTQRIFDGACGSGMLLTAAFRRLMREQQARAEQRGLGSKAWGFRARSNLLLKHIFGGDIDEDACRLTSFSLYLALLSDLTPRDLAVLQQGGHKLPKLGKNIRSGVAGNFFSKKSETANRRKFSLFLSNPPWRELTADEPAANDVRDWQQRQPAPQPRIPNRQIAAAFTLGAANCLKSGGKGAFILPVNPFVSAKSTTRQFRADLLGLYHIDCIANFSDMRRLIFADAKHPFVVLLATARPHNKRYKSISEETFEYWTPKTDISLAFGRLAVHGVDRSKLAASSLIDETPQLCLRYWGTEQDVSLLRRLQRQGNIRSLMRLGWTSSKGFHLKDEDRRRPRNSWYVAAPEWMKAWPFLDAKNLPNDVPIVQNRVLSRFSYEQVARDPGKQSFEGPRVIWPDGTHPENGVKAFFADQPFTFQHSLGALSAPATQQGRLLARFLTAYLRSPLGIWLSLLLSSSVASERPKLHLEELLEWPFWLPEQHPRPAEAHGILFKIDRAFTQIEEAPELTQPHKYQVLKEKLDGLVFDYFGLRDEERILVSEMANFAGPSLQPSSLRYSALAKPLRIPPSTALLHSYCGRLREVFLRWRNATNGSGDIIAAPWTARTVPIGAAVLQLQSPRKPSIHHKISSDEVLDDLANSIERIANNSTDQLLTIPNLTVVDDDRIIIIKPLVTRFWLERAAIEDASRIALEIQAIGRTRIEA